MQMNSPSRTQAILMVLLFTLAVLPLAAEESSSSPNAGTSPSSPAGVPAGRSLETMAGWIGMDIDRALRTFGTPSSMYPLRGKEAWQDDVVFSWPDLELFWFQNRVWQLRFFFLDGLGPASQPDDVRALLGEPLFDHGSTWVYQLGGFAWPLRLRVDFASAGEDPDAPNPSTDESSSDATPPAESPTLSAFYLYRADF